MPEIITRRQLPHWYVPGAAHFVTYRLAGSIPQVVLDDLKKRHQATLKEGIPHGRTRGQFFEQTHKRFFAEYDQQLDTNREIRDLANPRVAAKVRENLYHFHDVKYRLLAYCIMPNHVHVLLQPLEGSLTITEPADDAAWLCGETDDSRSPLSGVMHSLKSYTAHEANKILRRSGPFWQHESYDHWVRDGEELERIAAYIAANPVRAQLVGKAVDWFFCSSHDRYLRDGSEDGWLHAPLPAEKFRACGAPNP